MFGKATTVISATALALICAVGVTAQGTVESPAAGVLAPIGTAFTYQGQLQRGDAPVNGACDFEFSLWDAAGGGNQVGPTQPATDIPVTHGLFAVQLNFGDGAFTGQARWLQTAVRCSEGSSEYTTLAPRQALTPVPYALFSQDLALPFQKGINSPSKIFVIRQDGGAGAAITAESSGSGRALEVFADGTGNAAFFGINDPVNGSTVINARTVGTGGVAHLHIDNPENAASVVDAITKGTGGVAGFRIDNPLNSGVALWLETNGSGWATLFAKSTGTGGVADFRIDNPNSDAEVLKVRTLGTGLPGWFSIENPLNTHSALKSQTNGSGSAGSFVANGSGRAVSAETSGSGPAIDAKTTGTNNVANLTIDNPNNAGNLINASTNGLGRGASITINNTLNTEPAFYASTDGSGNVVHVNAYGSGTAVAGWSFGSGWAAAFSQEGSGNGVRISAPTGSVGLSVVSGTKTAVVGSSEGAYLLYSEESSGVWFSDYGFGRLTDGSACIAIDPIYAETVNLDEPYHVFVQPYGDAELYVSQRTPAGFEVRLRAGDPGVQFSYRLVAVRRGYEETRLERAPWADDDPNLYPEQPAAPGEGGAR